MASKLARINRFISAFHERDTCVLRGKYRSSKNGYRGLASWTCPLPPLRFDQVTQAAGAKPGSTWDRVFLTYPKLCSNRPRAVFERIEHFVFHFPAGPVGGREIGDEGMAVGPRPKRNYKTYTKV